MELRGLQNEEHNNCYLNVIIQAFWSFFDLRSEFISIVHQHEKTECVSCELSVLFTQNLLVNMQYSSLKVLSVASLKQVLYCKYHRNLVDEFGCAVETFEDILQSIHSESQDTINNECHFQCLCHKYFGFTFYDELTCCGFTEKSELQASTSIMIYAKDIKSNSQISSKFQDLLYLSMNLYEKDQVCQNCEKFILRRRKFTQTPNVLPVTVIWSCRDMATSEILLRSLDLTLRLEDLEGEGFYWLKTIVSFTVNHYCCYIYFPTHKCWQLIDDTRMTKFSNITQVTNHILRTSGLPVILFYEQSTQGISLELGENVLEEFTCLNCTSF